MTRQIALDTTGVYGPRLLHLASMEQQHAAFYFERAQYWREHGEDELYYVSLNMEKAAFHSKQARLMMGIE